MPKDRDGRLCVPVGCDGGDQTRPPGRLPETRGTLEVSEFSPREPSPLAESRSVVAAVGAVASALLHIALLTTAIWPGSRERIPKHPSRGITASNAPVADEIALQWVTIDESSTGASARDTAKPVLSPPTLTPVWVTADLLESEADFAEEAPDASSTSVASDSETSARIRGQYMGQINARVDRAWVRPREPIGDDRFICQVRIEQDAADNVIDVALEQCNGSARWQRSLVEAIESASPLPAPSDPSVYARVVHMGFQADSDAAVAAEQSGTASVATRTITSDRTTVALEAVRGLHDTTPHPEGTRVIDLRIEGPSHSDSYDPSIRAETNLAERR